MSRQQLVLMLLIALEVVLLAQEPSVRGGSDPVYPVPEGHDFTFARVQFNSFSGRGRGRGRGGRNPGWRHDYPRAEIHLLKILGEVTNIRTTPESYVVVQLDDPELMKYPFLYFSEPGTWDITPEEAANFREYLDRGGFAIFDDFDGQRDWRVFESCMGAVYPERRFEELQVQDPIFHCFFDIETLDMVPPYSVRGGLPEFLALRDEAGRILAVANFNNDIGDFWEWSDESFYPVDLSNEAYKLGINYVVYAMTH
ncbi:MAG TPA: DUF4159 domain-containing protein [Acidobacteriota bacterium]|nr:DUF4159 domain-containing protein [Acidobacteriota bacterium]